MTTTLSTKGQVVIPAEIREKLGLPPGAVLTCELRNGKIILDPGPAAVCATTSKRNGRVVLVPPEGAPEITPELVKDILHT